jgi:phosphopantothenoylcysteine decarboxylase/phosphopantothenate--cysteine ligase
MLTPADRPKRRILLGVTGGIAAYKAAALTSFLVQRGDDVDVVMTEDAQRFIGALTFSALTRRHVYTSLWEAPQSIPHITLVREADVFAIVPATANVIAKLANGIADDLLSNAALAARIPLVVAPAMNSAMYEHPATRENLRRLSANGVRLVLPETGFLAERESGIGRLAEQDAIVAAIDAALAAGEELRGRRVLVTAGPTREPIDPVRFISNASTGTMGIELAREALARGATVDLVLGPTSVEPPADATVHRVTTAQEMYDATLAVAENIDVAIASAAVADWRPAHVHPQKVKKTAGPSAIELERTSDVLAALGKRKNGTFLVGFAAETERLEEHARAKLRAKNLDAIAVNDVSRADGGFGLGESELTLLWGDDGRLELGRSSKRELARRMWDALLEIRRGDG